MARFLSSGNHLTIDLTNLTYISFFFTIQSCSRLFKGKIWYVYPPALFHCPSTDQNHLLANKRLKC